ncbi:MAG: sterol desaturase family protein [Chitinophagales bacterium]
MEEFIQKLPYILVGTSFRYFLFAGIPFLIFYVFFKQHFHKNKIQASSEKRKRFVSEVKNSLVTLAVLATTGALVFFSPFRAYTTIYADIHTFPLWWIPVSVVLSLVIHDTYFYWMHRLVHGKTLFRLVHRTHHESVNPSPWTSYSFHILEALLENLILFILVFTLPLHPIALILFGLVSFTINVYGHLGYEIMPQWYRHSFLFEVVNTSVHHNLHHKKFHGNYGLYFRFWDRLMGTENPDYVAEFDKIQERRFGEIQTPKKSYSRAAFLWGALAIGFFSLSFNTQPAKQANILGEWTATGEMGDAVIEIFEDANHKIQGKLIRALDPEHQQRIEEAKAEKSVSEILLLRNFDYVGDNTWKNGTLYLLSRKRSVNGDLKLLPSGELQVTGKLMGFSRTHIWKRKS